MEADNLSLTRKERRAKANREASLKKPIVSPNLRSSPFDFVFFTWFGPILRLVSWCFLLLACNKVWQILMAIHPAAGIQKTHPALRSADSARHS